MRLHNLPKITTKKAKRVGRGKGSGKGKMSGRGMKGQKARSKIKPWFEGGRLRLTQRFPFIRGRGFRGPQRKPVIVNIEKLNRFRGGSKVTVELLQKENLISQKIPYGVKILGRGELTKKLRVASDIKLSEGAKKKIEEAGGIQLKQES